MYSILSSVHDNPSNSSSSKQLYSIPKAKRFQTLPESEEDKRQLFLPQTPKSPTHSFGKQVKRTFISQVDTRSTTPAPSQYRLSSDIEEQLRQRKGISMSPKSKSSLLSCRGRDSPGPKYSPQIPMISSQIAFGRQKRMAYSNSNDSPGPSYKLDLSKLDKVVSKYHKAKSVRLVKLYSETMLLRLKNVNQRQPKGHANSFKQLSPKYTQRNQPKPSLTDRKNIKTQLDQLDPSLFLTDNLSTMLERKIPQTTRNRDNPETFGKNKVPFNKARRTPLFSGVEQHGTPGPAAYNSNFSEFSPILKLIKRDRIKLIKSSLNTGYNRQTKISQIGLTPSV